MGIHPRETRLTGAVSISGVDLRGHLIGAQAVIQASQDQSPSMQASSFRQACLWAAFRQELYIGLKEHRPVRCQAPRNSSRVNIRDDWQLALRAVSDCAEVVNCVFGNDKSPETIDHLTNRLRSWQRETPVSFRPLGQVDRLNFPATEFVGVALLAPCHGGISEAHSIFSADHS